MNLLIRKIDSLHTGWNQRILTEKDFYALCRREKIKPVQIPLVVPGFYMVCGGKRFIYTDSKIRGVRWLYVAFHELAHHYFHTPPAAAAASFFRLKPDSKQEFEAEAFAVIALIPEPKLRLMLTEEIESEYEREILAFRLKVLDMFNV